MPMSKRRSGMFIGLPSSPSMTRVDTNARRPSTAGSSASNSPIDHLRSSTSPTSRMDSLSVPNGDGPNGKLNKRKSFDAGIRPLNVLRQVASSASLNTSNGAPTDYTRSLSASTATPSSVRGRESPQPHSPLRDYFSSYYTDQLDSDHADSPISPPDSQRVVGGRGRSASSSAYEQQPTRGPNQRPTLNLDKIPSRSNGLAVTSPLLTVTLYVRDSPESPRSNFLLFALVPKIVTLWIRRGRRSHG